MRSHLRIGLAVLATVSSLVASEGANAARLNYTGQTATDVSADYFDLPAGTTIVFLNQVSGIKTATPTSSGPSGVTYASARSCQYTSTQSDQGMQRK